MTGEPLTDPRRRWWKRLNYGAIPGLLACLVPLVLHLTGVAFQ